jgi:WD40 repeat protein
LDTFTVQKEASLGPTFAIRVSQQYMFSGHLNSIKVTLYKMKNKSLIQSSSFCCEYLFNMQQVWDLHRLECKSTLSGHIGNVKALCVVGNRLYSGSSDRSIKVSVELEVFILNDINSGVECGYAAVPSYFEWSS